MTYETATATLIQFIVLSLLNIANGVNSVVTTCRQDGGSCISNLLVSMIFYLLVVLWFGFVWILGYAAQERRSKRLAQVLIAAELAIALVAYFNIRHHNHKDFLGVTTSVIDLVLALWVITLAYRLMKAKGGRVVVRQRRRPQPRKPS